MITINDLKKQFGEKVAVDIAEFEIHDGEILGLVGNNGAGKTTLFRLMLDLLEADNGTVSINGINPALSEEWKNDTGAYIDEGFLIDFLTPEEYFEFIGSVADLSKEEISQRLELYSPFMADEIMGQNKLIRDYSAGNKQKIGIIATLLNEPHLVVLDEPFNFLDPSSQNLLKSIMTEYQQRTGATVIISSHNLQHTIDISTRIALLEHGHIISDLDNTEGKAREQLEEYFRT